MKRPQTIGDFSAVITGMLVALICRRPYHLSAGHGSLIAIVVKQMFGGLGQNCQSALAARIILTISFPAAMTLFVAPRPPRARILSISHPLAMLRNQFVPLPDYLVVSRKRKAGSRFAFGLADRRGLS